MLLFANKNKTAQMRFVQVLEIFYLLFGGAAGPALVGVLAFSVLNGLPLHVAVVICATSTEIRY